MKKYVDEESLKQSIGKTYDGAWICEETSKIGEAYTETIVLPKGKYVIIITTPYSESSETSSEQILINFSADLNPGRGIIYINPCYDQKVFIGSFEKETKLFAASAASANNAVWSLLERGGISAIKIGD